jgi:TatD DNase family protein
MIIDSHCHLHAPAFDDVWETVRTAHAHSVWGVVAVGCDPRTNVKTLGAAAAAPKTVWAALGFHPEQDGLTDADLDEVERQVQEHHAHIIALGEVGLPWYSLANASDAADRMARAHARLERLLATAKHFDLPVILHAPHGAAVGALAALRRHGIERAVFHWHKAPEEVTRSIVDAGYFVSVTPEVVYRERDRALVGAVPLTSLLVETDAPWTYRGEFEGLPSGPWLASRVAEEVAKLKRIPVDDVMFELTGNVCRLFDLQYQ